MFKNLVSKSSHHRRGAERPPCKNYTYRRPLELLLGAATEPGEDMKTDKDKKEEKM